VYATCIFSSCCGTVIFSFRKNPPTNLYKVSVTFRVAMTHVDNTDGASDNCLFRCLTALHTRIGALEAVQTDWRYNVCYRSFRNGAQPPDENVIQYHGRTYETAEEWWNAVVYRAVMDECAGLATPTSLSFGANGVAESACKPFRRLSGPEQTGFEQYFHNVHAFRSPLVINVYFH